MARREKCLQLAGYICTPCKKRLLLYNWVQNLGRCEYKKYTQNRFSSLQKKRAQTLKVVSNSCYFYT
jgi:hypothetical protein